MIFRLFLYFARSIHSRFIGERDADRILCPSSLPLCSRLDRVTLLLACQRNGRISFFFSSFQTCIILSIILHRQMEILGRINGCRVILFSRFARDICAPEMHPALLAFLRHRGLLHTSRASVRAYVNARAGFKVLRYPSRKSNYRVIADKNMIAHWTFRTRCNYAWYPGPVFK